MATCDTVIDPPVHHEASVTFIDPIAIQSNQAHDLENWRVKLMRAICVARHDSNDAESLKFLDGVFSQPTFLQCFTALEILSHQLVCPSWAAWIHNNITTIASARRQDDSHDWYFPVFDPMLQDNIPSSILPLWDCSGIWHATADHSSEGLFHSLPHFSFPPRLLCNGCQPRYDVIASFGGLLLIQTLSFCEGHKRYQGVVQSDCNCLGQGEWRWPSLMVINPLTKKLRVLPAFDDPGAHRWSMDSFVQGQIMVDDEANTYKVLLYSCIWTCFFVYDSKSGSWQYECHIPTPMGEPELGSSILTDTHIDWKYYASACVKKRLYFADIRFPTPRDWQINPDMAGVLRLLEKDIDTGDWKLCKDFPFGKMYHRDIGIVDVIDFHSRCVMRNLELVECMGHIFAVIPAMIDEFVYPWKNVPPTTYTSVPESKSMPLQFYIFQLDGEDVDDGVVRIEIPTTESQDYLYNFHRVLLFLRSLTKNYKRIKRGQGNWFSCTAKGSVIWVSYEDYLVQYDIVSRQSKTQIIPKTSGCEFDYNRVGFSYRASFNMKP